MAMLSHFTYRHHRPNFQSGQISWVPLSRTIIGAQALEPMEVARVPILLDADGEPILPVNLWLTARAQETLDGDLDISTIHRDAWCLLNLFQHLESVGMDWAASGPLKSDHPTYRYRSHLKRLRKEGGVAATTASQQMSTVARFYHWATENRLLATGSGRYSQRNQKAQFTTEHGTRVEKEIFSTDLHLPKRRKHARPRLPGGLLPVSIANREKILSLSNETASTELYLMLSIGFFSGMRLQSILDLKLQTLRNAEDAETDDFKYLLIGPRHNVATKFSIDGRILIPTALLTRLDHYAHSLRRFKRVAKADAHNRDILFINRNGQRYGRRGEDRAPSVNVDMHRLRKVAAAQGLNLQSFYFHCTRATFATGIVQAGLNTEGVSIDAIVSRLTELLLHADEATSLRYVRFVEQSKILTASENNYSDWLFNGIRQP